MTPKTKTSSFGVSRREGHDSSSFYNRNLYGRCTGRQPGVNKTREKSSQSMPASDWYNRIYHQSAESMPLPDESVALAFTSPPYNVGKDYDNDLSLEDYLDLISQVGREVHRVLIPGGRYIINIANLGRKPYIPLHALFYQVHGALGFAPMGEIIWQKANGANGSCAWGSWMSAKSPRVRDIHEYLLVFSRDGFSRPDNGKSDISSEEFMAATLSVWQIPAESARRVGHPAPFPLELAGRVVKLFSFVGDVVLDPFVGSGTTCVAAKQLGRRYVGFDVVPEYCRLAEERLEQVGEHAARA